VPLISPDRQRPLWVRDGSYTGRCLKPDDAGIVKFARMDDRFMDRRPKRASFLMLNFNVNAAIR
jgi:hypothetical protein